jgi:tetratricopeptide (TPR) repeat protein
VASFRLALQLDASSAALHEQLAQCLMEMEQHEAALQAAEAATALQPDVSLLVCQKSTLHLARADVHPLLI